MNFHFTSEVLMRTPALPFNRYSEEELRELCCSEMFRSAILLSSPSFYLELKKKHFDYTRLNNRERHSLRKYFNRMCYRPTPFGLFAGFARVPWYKDAAAILLGEQRALLKADQGLYLALAAKLQEKLGEHGAYVLNSTLYHTGGEFRFFGTQHLPGVYALQFTMESFEASAFIKQLLKFCASERSKPEIMTFIAATEHTKEEAEQLFDELVTQQVLVSAYSARITGPDLITELLAGCERFGLQDDEVIAIAAINALLNGSSLAVESAHAKITDLLSLAGIKHTAGKNHFYASMEKEVTAGGLPEAMQQQLLDGLDCLAVLNQRKRSLPAMEKFKKDFLRRFEARAVPLLLALDDEQGLTYGDSHQDDNRDELLETIAFAENGKANMEKMEWTPSHRLLLSLWNQDGTGGRKEGILVTGEMLGTLRKQDPEPLPASISILFRQTEGGLLIEQAGGASALSLSGRFSLFSPGIRDSCRGLAATEARYNPDVIFAEVVHLCDEHADNINRRDVLRDYEIPVLCRSGVPPARQIPLSDLFLKVYGGELILFSRQHGKRVIPRLSSAFNYPRNDLPVFRFLCDLQYDGLKSSFGLDLPAYFPGLNFYPRVKYKNTILFPATWFLNEKDTLPLLAVAPDAKLKAFSAFAKKFALPCLFTINRSDMQLLFDTTKQEDVLFFLDCIRSFPSLIIKEFSMPGALVRDARENIYVNQFVASLYRNQETFKGIRITSGKAALPARSFIPGSDWLYLKLYCHPARSNELAVSCLAPALSKIKQGSWFFIRYNDPEHHIRIRVKAPGQESSAFFRLLNNKLKQRREQVLKVQTDTYERELERYGFELIEDAEKLFFHCSSLTLAYIRISEKGILKHAYYSLGIYVVQRILQILLPDDELRLAFIRISAEAFLAEQGGSKSLRIQLDQQYRKLRTETQDLLRNRNYLQELRLTRKYARLEQAYRDFKLKAELSYPQEWEAILRSLLHMLLNRLFAREPRKHEMVVWYFLYKYNLSEIKRQKTTPVIF